MPVSGQQHTYGMWAPHNPNSRHAALAPWSPGGGEIYATATSKPPQATPPQPPMRVRPPLPHPHNAANPPHLLRRRPPRRSSSDSDSLRRDHCLSTHRRSRLAARGCGCAGGGAAAVAQAAGSTARVVVVVVVAARASSGGEIVTVRGGVGSGRGTCRLSLPSTFFWGPEALSPAASFHQRPRIGSAGLASFHGWPGCSQWRCGGFGAKKWGSGLVRSQQRLAAIGLVVQW
jgi:hypothetical protein